MSQYAALQAVLYEAEGAFCENVAFSAPIALSLVDTVDLGGLARARERIPIMQQAPYEGVQHALMPFDGMRITLKGPLAGVGATAAGAVPSSDLVTFLGLLIGNSASGLATGTTFTGGTAAVPTTTAANGVVAGAIVRGGAVGDAKVGGQMLPVASHAANALTLLLAAPAAPANGDVLYSSKMVYPTVLTGIGFETITSFRVRVITSNGVYNLRGCYPLSAPKFTLSLGQIPMWECEIGVSHVDNTTATFPSATVPQRHMPGPIVNGSLALQQVGTTTRAVEAVREFEIDLGFTGVGLKGFASNFEGQINTGCRRLPGMASAAFVVDKEAAGTDTWWDRAELDPTSAVFYHWVYTATAADGRAFGIYCPRAAIMEKQSIQVAHDGFNRQRVKLELQRGLTTTTDLTASPYRLAFA